MSSTLTRKLGEILATSSWLLLEPISDVLSIIIAITFFASTIAEHNYSTPTDTKLYNHFTPLSLLMFIPINFLWNP